MGTAAVLAGHGLVQAKFPHGTLRPQPVCRTVLHHALLPLLAVCILNFNFDQTIDFYFQVAASPVLPFPMGIPRCWLAKLGVLTGRTGVGLPADWGTTHSLLPLD